MRRLFAIVGVFGVFLGSLAGCCSSNCGSCGNGCGGGGSRLSNIGTRQFTHGICDCWYLDPCATRAPWYIPGAGEPKMDAPKTDAKK